MKAIEISSSELRNAAHLISRLRVCLSMKSIFYREKETPLFSQGQYRCAPSLCQISLKHYEPVSSDFSPKPQCIQEITQACDWRLTESFIKIRSWRMKISSVENLDSTQVTQQISCKTKINPASVPRFREPIGVCHKVSKMIFIYPEMKCRYLCPSPCMINHRSRCQAGIRLKYFMKATKKGKA